MNKQSKINTEFLSPPGDTIQETIDFIGMTHTELAARLGFEVESVKKLIEGSESLNEKTAVQLELTLGIPRDFWLERERIYREELFLITG